jgi:hypothetical protein
VFIRDPPFPQAGSQEGDARHRRHAERSSLPIRGNGVVEKITSTGTSIEVLRDLQRQVQAGAVLATLQRGGPGA